MATSIEIIPCPFNGGQPKKGVSEGPRWLLDAGLVEQIEEKLKLPVNAARPLLFTPPAHDPPFQGANAEIMNPIFVSEANQLVANEVHARSGPGKTVVNLGGDHSLGIGTVTGTLRAYPDACVIWVDAHADINTADTTFSGNMHGMPLSILMGIGRQIPQFRWVENTLTPDRLFYIGLRDVDSGERDILRQHEIKAYDMRDIDELGMPEVIRQVLQAVNNRPIHLSLDVDSIDPIWTPSTGTAVWGGQTVREGHLICRKIAQSGLLRTMDIVEVNPELSTVISSPADKTVAVANSLVLTALGEELL